jgi:hypothetical protein
MQDQDQGPYGAVMHRIKLDLEHWMLKRNRKDSGRGRFVIPFSDEEVILDDQTLFRGFARAGCCFC